MPASTRINNEKSNCLITQTAVERARERITEWWKEAFLSEGTNARHRFFLEAEQTLPMLEAAASPADLIHAMKVQRVRLAKDHGCGHGSQLQPGSDLYPLLISANRQYSWRKR